MMDGDTLLDDDWGETQALGLLSRLGVDVRESKKGTQLRFAPRGRWSPPGELLSEAIENLIGFGPVMKVVDCSLELHFACALAQDGDDVVTLAESAWEGSLYADSKAEDLASEKAELATESPDPVDNIIPFRSVKDAPPS